MACSANRADSRQRTSTHTCLPSVGPCPPPTPSCITRRARTRSAESVQPKIVKSTPGRQQLQRRTHTPSGSLKRRLTSSSGPGRISEAHLRPYVLPARDARPPPVVGQPADQPQPEAARPTVSFDDQRRSRAIVHLLPEATVIDTCQQVRRRTGMRHDVGDQLIDNQLGVLDELGRARQLEQPVTKCPTSDSRRKIRRFEQERERGRRRHRTVAGRRPTGLPALPSRSFACIPNIHGQLPIR